MNKLITSIYHSFNRCLTNKSRQGYHTLVFVLLLSIPNFLSAQIEAPDFLCVKSDTLFWDLPVNTCGPFVAYNIYASPDMGGPFFLLATITDPTQTNYWHDNTNNDTWFYYLESDFDCPGEPVLSSIILSNQAPEASPILVANVVNGKAQIEWQSSPSPQVVGYVIFKVTDIGTIPIDTIYNSTTYTDLNSDPDLQAENYYVIAIDACGNTSLLESPHLTIHIKAEVSACEQIARLKWNLYEGWTSGIERQELWMEIGGDPPQLVETFAPGDTAYTFEQLDDALQYCFYIRSYQNGNAVFSVSNRTCFTTDIVQPMRNITLTNATVNSANEVELRWQWDSNAEINAVDILRAPQNNAYVSFDSYAPMIPLALQNNYTDLGATPQSGPVYYQVQTTDDCDSLANSNYVATIHLQGNAADNFINQLSWTAFQSPIGEVIAYELFRVDASGVNAIATVVANETTYADETDPYLPSDANVCYYVIAEVEVSLPDGGSTIVYSQSNTACVEQRSGILAPNAFVPGGKNKEFKPLLVFGNQVDYNMSIWDRWGQKVFETTDINKGWTGRNGFFEFPAGAYTYMIKIVQPEGRVVEDSGVVILVR